jgi:hypothetical protein
VEEYTLRNLTYPSDILNAFAGVLRDHCKSMKTTSFYGLPTSIFDMALLWQPSSDNPRRQGFPSLSWAGWHGGVRWLGDTMVSQHSGRTSEDYFADITKWLEKHTWITLYQGTVIDEADLIWRSDQPPTNQVLGKASDIGYTASKSTPSNPCGRSCKKVDIISLYLS